MIEAVQNISNVFSILKPLDNVKWTLLTLLASNTHGILEPSGNVTFESKSFFHLTTASNVDALVTSKTIKHPTASL